MSAIDLLYEATVAFGAGRFERAADACRRAAARGASSRVLAEGARYLARVRDQGRAEVYVTPDAFRAFIRSGGNRALYAATSAALREEYRSQRVLSGSGASRLLDLGVGDGLALLPALSDDIASVVLVEPSGVMLDATAAALRARGLPHEAIQATAQDFVAARRDGFDLAQATFSLQSLEAAERAPVLEWLARHASRLLLVEFDVPRLEGKDAVRHAASRYEVGLAEHEGDGGLVAQGFLMPVFFGYFDGTGARTNHEQPIDGWAVELERAGFATIEKRRLYAYWWADAYLVSARSRR
jgi:hypothetical protein